MKLKTKRAAYKRFRFSASGKVKVQRPGRRHNLHQKSEKRKRAMNHPSYLPAADVEHANRQLPYGGK